ncbi:TPA: conjugal transfer protein TraM [Legionella pneumophila]|uniref:conjugal transfer protein TraM n=1 Tax=Legionella pneumophila TaxID=446 RepID=UPI001A193200|nr:conjugal transfer protein TraM [Legionella pneumophila]MCZ4682189.1 conjugal transfer protein TraM [Legionella pneumophila]HAU0949081.1 conjugal transfer protein TraM [Legionella pneumophila]HAU1288287.1 conjugal transfer protein TraM [Legionella pneumophila]
MSEKTDKILQEIAIKHGIVLGKDDPILILQTMNDRLIEETRQAQAEMLAQFREEMEAISSRWKDDAKEKAEKVLNVALTASTDAMERILRESTNSLIQIMTKKVSDSLIQAHDLTQKTRKLSQFILLSLVTLTTCCLILLFFLMPM